MLANSTDLGFNGLGFFG